MIPENEGMNQTLTRIPLGVVKALKMPTNLNIREWVRFFKVQSRIRSEINQAEKTLENIQKAREKRRQLESIMPEWTDWARDSIRLQKQDLH